MSVNRIIDKFNEMGNLPNPDSAYKLKSSKLILKNVRTSQYDTVTLYKLTVINFWASWCKPCIQEQTSLEKLSHKIRIIQLSFDTIENQRKVINSNHWTIPAYALNDTFFFKQPAILPMTLILQDSTVIKQIYGQQNWADTLLIKYFETVK